MVVPLQGLKKKVEEEIEIDPVINEDGEEIKQFKKIKKDKPVKCAILKPSRSLYEEGELFYSVELSKYIQADANQNSFSKKVR